ncbi:ABC transporter substrate-binding protein [Bacillus sp. 03113]|uniref:ABC transporter substrate-binding protein n=1 Tax=Bacillus sp. 03113 TaxID=2578211 RepID=UPI0011433FA1|nr:ABC transporter substrate-binding protein [Bacillus sp. 03113]
MKRLYSLLMAVMLVLGVLTACGQTNNQNSSNEKKTEQTEQAAFPVKIKDAGDNEVVIDKKPEKIVSLIPSNTEIAFELGLGDEIVGVSEFDNYPEEVAKKEKVGGMDFNVEKIISLKPNLVLAHASSAHNSKEGLQQLKDAGITVLVVNDAQNFDQVYDSIEMIGKATGEKAKADTLVDEMKNKIADIKKKAADIQAADKKKVYVEISGAPDVYSTGKNTFMDEMLSVINAENIITEDGWVKVDPEEVIKQNPDVIVTTYGYYVKDAVDQVLNREGWQNVSAIKNKQVVDVDSDKVTRSGPRIVEGVEELAKAVYPDVFK